MLRDAARLLRALHDATVDFPRAGRVWLHRLCAAYGAAASPAAVLAVVPERLEELAQLTEGRAAVSGDVGLYRADATYVRRRRAALLDGRRS